MRHKAERESRKQILRGQGREIHAVPDDDFEQAIRGLPERMASRLAFMSPEHHMIRDFVVRELPRQNRAISPLRIAQIAALSVEKVAVILEDLEMHLFFLVRNPAGDVSWAFPVTTCRTPHRLTFSTGDKTFGA
jgi:hypothetical protein